MDSRAVVLVVDDDPTVLKLLTEVLADSYTVIGASSGIEAIAAFKRHNAAVNLLITDVQMPGMNGVELADSLLTVKPNLPVLYISGDPNADIVQQRIVSRGYCFLPKPFAVGALVSEVSKLIGSKIEFPAAG